MIIMICIRSELLLLDQMLTQRDARSDGQYCSLVNKDSPHLSFSTNLSLSLDFFLGELLKNASLNRLDVSSPSSWAGDCLRL